ncbi:unnamed protein product [Dicrocoelium dendriticum]|nr:unnamed protein product [Dicrocoelium dendriticum]
MLRKYIENSDLWADNQPEMDVTLESKPSYTTEGNLNWPPIKYILSKLILMYGADSISLTKGLAPSFMNSVRRQSPGDFEQHRFCKLQNLLRNLGLHDILLQLLEVPITDKTALTDEVIKLTKTNICAFCFNNPTNQASMSRYLERFLTEEPDDAMVYAAIIFKNPRICEGIESQHVRHFALCLQHKGPRFSWLCAMSSILCAAENPPRDLQDLIITELFPLKDSTLRILHDVRNLLGQFERIEHNEEFDEDCLWAAQPSPISHQLAAIHLFKQKLNYGHRAEFRRSCRVYLLFLENVYFDTDLNIKPMWSPNSQVWKLWEILIAEINEVPTRTSILFLWSYAKSHYFVNISDPEISFGKCLGDFAALALQNGSSVVVEADGGVFSFSKWSELKFASYYQALDHNQMIDKSSTLPQGTSTTVNGKDEVNCFGEALLKTTVRLQVGSTQFEKPISYPEHLTLQGPLVLENVLQLISSRLEMKMKHFFEGEKSMLISFICRPGRASRKCKRCQNGPLSSALYSSFVHHTRSFLRRGENERFIKMLKILKLTIYPEQPQSICAASQHNKSSNLSWSIGDEVDEFKKNFLLTRTLKDICDLVIHCITEHVNNDRVFNVSAEIAYRLLRRGGASVQEEFFRLLAYGTNNGEFFRAIFQRLHNAITQISFYNERSTVTFVPPSKCRIHALVSCLCKPHGRVLHAKELHSNTQEPLSLSRENYESLLIVLKLMRSLCAKQHAGFQDLLRVQRHNVTSYNLIEETQLLLICLARLTPFGVSMSSDHGASHAEQMPKHAQNLHTRPQCYSEAGTHDRFPTRAVECSNYFSIRDNPPASITLLKSRNLTQNVGYSKPQCQAIVNLLLLVVSCLLAFCQGPCSATQKFIATENPDALELIGKIVISSPKHLFEPTTEEETLRIKLKVLSCRLILALLEGGTDSQIYRRLRTLFSEPILIHCIREHYGYGTSNTSHSGDVRKAALEAGHLVYLIFRKLHLQARTQKNKLTTIHDAGNHTDYAIRNEWSNWNFTWNEKDYIKGRSQMHGSAATALQFYACKTGEIEIVGPNGTEKICFQIPPICEHLSVEIRIRMLANYPLDEHSSKVASLFDHLNEIYAEMLCQKTLSDQGWYRWLATNSQRLFDASFYTTVFINVLIAFYFPFETDWHQMRTVWILKHQLYLWPIIPGFCITSAYVTPQIPVYVTVAISTLSMLTYFGAKRTIFLLGLANMFSRTLSIYIMLERYRVLRQSQTSLITTNGSSRWDREEFQQMRSSRRKAGFGWHERSTVVSHDDYMGLVICRSFLQRGIQKINGFAVSFAQRLMTTNHGVQRNICLELLFLLLTYFGIEIHPFFHSIVLLDVINREETLTNVIRAVTKNGRSIMLTALLALVILYIYAVVGFLYFKDDFVLEVEHLGPHTYFHCDVASNSFATEEVFAPKDGNLTDCIYSSSVSEARKERHCDSLRMCILTTLHEGLRSGGGIADVLRRPSIREERFLFRTIYDLSFFVLVIIIILNVVFGVIVDTFAALRQERQHQEELVRNNCCVCGLQRGVFEKYGRSFGEHVEREHNIWQYVFFIIHLRLKPSTQYTGPESYVAKLIQQKDLKWIPRKCAMSLSSAETSQPQASSEYKQLVSQLAEVSQGLLQIKEDLHAIRDHHFKHQSEHARERLLFDLCEQTRRSNLNRSRSQYDL